MAAGYLLLARVSQVFRGELPKELGACFYSFYFRVMQDQGIFFPLCCRENVQATSTWTHYRKSTNTRLLCHRGLSHILVHTTRQYI